MIEHIQEPENSDNALERIMSEVRKQTAQAIHDMIKPKIWPNNKYIVTTTCDILDKIVKEYNL